LSAKAAKDANVESILTAPITELLEEFGLQVESPGYLTGKSGTKHKFDIIANGKNKKKKKKGRNGEDEQEIKNADEEGTTKIKKSGKDKAKK